MAVDFLDPSVDLGLVEVVAVDFLDDSVEAGACEFGHFGVAEEGGEFFACAAVGEHAPFDVVPVVAGVEEFAGALPRAALVFDVGVFFDGLLRGVGVSHGRLRGIARA